MSDVTIKVTITSTTFEVTTATEEMARKLIDDLTAKFFGGDGYNDETRMLSQ